MIKKSVIPTIKTVNEFLNCLSSIQDAYAERGDRRFYAYGKAITSIKELGLNKALKCLTKGHKITFVGDSITSKWNEYVTKGKISKMKELGIKDPNIIVTTKSSSKSDNVHKHYTKRDTISTLIKPMVDFLKRKGYGEPIITGSYRREKPEVGDVDLLYVGKSFDFTYDKGDKIKFDNGTFVFTACGKKKMKGEFRDNKRKVIEIDFRIFPKSQLGTALCYFTGPFEHNIYLRRVAKSKGMKLSEYGITDSEGILHKFSTEKGVYKYLGVKYKEPWER